jgi:hypothetical protein
MQIYIHIGGFLISCMTEVGGLGVTLDHLHRGREGIFKNIIDARTNV